MKLERRECEDVDEDEEGEKQMRNVFSPTRHSDTSKDKSILQKCFFENMKTVSSTIFYVICCG
jgi:hypothetical protein